MYASVYVNCWDIFDEGIEETLRRLKDFGFNGINLAVSYHSGRYLLPHNPRGRIYFAEEDVVYFNPHPENYRDTRLRPRRSQRYRDVDILKSVVERAGEYGFKVNAWTVCLHNSSFIRENPELGVQDPYGGIDYNFMCPNNPDARNYMLGLVRDLASNYELNMIHLESATYPWGIFHNDHHEEFYIIIEPFLSSLFSTCFCKHCVGKAEEYGFDLVGVREEVRDMIEEGISMPSHILSKVPPEDSLEYYLNTILEMEELRDLIDYKFQVAEEVFRDAGRVIEEANPKIKLATGVSLKGNLAGGINLPSISRIMDVIILPVYFDSPQRVYYHVKRVKKRLSDPCKLYPILKVSYPEAFSRSTIIEEIVAAKEAGADGLEFYNYGRTPLENFKWVKEGLDMIDKNL